MNIQTAPIMEPEVMEPLPIEDRAKLIDLEKVIEESRNKVESSFKDLGDALSTICEQKLYRSEYKTFESYVKNRWDISRSRAYQIIDARTTFRLLSTQVDKLTMNAARQLSGLSDDEKEEAGKELAKVQKKKGKVTPKDAKNAANKEP